MGKRQIVEGPHQSARIARRKTLGSLKSLLIRPATVVRYERAFKAFLTYLEGQGEALASSIQALDAQAIEYLNYL